MVKLNRRYAAHLMAHGALSLAACACNVSSTGENTGGVSDGGDDVCPAGTTIVLSDYFSTQVALSSLEGETLSASFISSASTEASQLASPLGGDVAAASEVPSGRIVLLDRYGKNVVTWVDPATAEVLGQLHMGADEAELVFESNPYDYVEIDERLAFVTRWGHNPSPQHPDGHDAGSDVLIIDTVEFGIVGRIALPMDGELPPRPAGMLRHGDEIIVTLDRVATDFQSTGDAELVGLSVSDQSVSWRHTLTGHKNCSRVELSPDGERLAVACSGRIGEGGVVEDIEQSAVLLFDASERPLRQLARFGAAEIAGEAIRGDLAFATDDLVLLTTQTPIGGDAHSRWLAFDLETAAATELLEASPDVDGKGLGQAFGSSTCAPSCSDVCLMADSADGVLQRVRIGADGSVELLDPVQVESQVGMPPRGIALR